MLLKTGRLNVKRLKAGHPDGKPYTQIVVGTSDTPVTADDTSITGAFAKDITSVDYSDEYHVQFNTLLESTDPAIVIKEVGLLNADGVLCYRKVVPAQNKIVGVAIAVQYKIKVL